MPLDPAFDRPEIQLLHGAARARLSEADVERLAALLTGSSLEWSFILEMAARHGLSALLHQHLETPRFHAHIPSPVSLRLKQQATYVHQRNLALTGALVEAVRSMETEGVRVLALKGPTLALQAYGTLGLRPFNDLDLLVHQADLKRAGAILQKMEYTLPQKQPSSSWLGNNPHELLFFRSAARIEVKTTLDKLGIGSGNMDLATYWPGRAHCDVGGQCITTLGIDDLLLYLCLHGSIHGWSCLKWLVDLVALQTAVSDWSAMLAQAAERECLEAFLLGWYLLREVFGKTLPDALQGAVEATPGLPRLARRCAALWYSPGIYPLQLHRYRFELLNGWFRRVCYVSKYLFKPTYKDWAALPLIPPSTPLVFSLYRPARLCADITRSAIRRRSAKKRSWEREG